MLYQKGTFTGNYGSCTGYPDAFENVIALEFGAPSGDGYLGRVNEATAAYLNACCRNQSDPSAAKKQCFFVSKSIYDALIKLRFQGKVCVVSHGSSTLFGANDVLGRKYDTFEHVREAAKKIHDEKRDKACLIVTHANLAGRAARQAKKCGLIPYFPPDLPRKFDPESPQVWCRNQFYWVLREIAVQPYLKLIGRL